MTDTIFRPAAIVFLFAVVLAAVSMPVLAHAKQVSTDSRLLTIYKEVDNRNREHMKVVAEALKGLEALKGIAKTLEDEIGALPASLSPSDASREQILTARLTNINAQLYNKLGRLLDARAAVIEANLTDLARVVKEMQKSGGSIGRVGELERRIEKNISAGRAMRFASQELRDWSRQNPSMRPKFKSLSRLMSVMDRKISRDKVRLAVRRKNNFAGRGDRTITTLNMAIDRLADKHVEIMAEKQALRDVREELDLNIRLGRLRITEEIARKTIPGGGSDGPFFSGLPSIGKFTESIARVNDRIIREMNKSELNGDAGKSVSGGLSIGEFKNF
jgi:hypothetical protein